ncbi:MAG: sensor signal transduction histidine kinase [Myxococcaceae bacterium]|nr:sensor signal transduction histidine kinase [Myxococcaceae bacterium]
MKRQDDQPSEELLDLRARVRVLEAELQMRDEFIIAAAHELRNPISPLMLHVNRLQSAARKALEREPGQGSAGAARAEAGTVDARWLSDQMDVFGRRLTRFLSALNRILDVSSIHSGRIQLVLEQVDLGEVVRDVTAGFERELAASTSELTLELEPVVRGEWDRMRLEQIVSNLVSNAIRYGDGGPIWVSLTGTETSVELAVADRGIGIAMADQARIFERGERAHRQYRSGFGVGLWMVQQLSEAMGGTVKVESTPGEGSCFRVTLPTKRNGSGDDS